MTTNSGTGGSSSPDGPRALGPAALIYIERVRKGTRRLSARELAPEDVRAALQVVRDVASFDVEVPTSSPRREVELVKKSIKRLVAWYMRYLSSQLNAFGESTVRLGDALVAGTARVESSCDELAARLGAVEERLRRLEAAAPAEGGPPKPSSSGPPAGRGSPGARSTPGGTPPGGAPAGAPSKDGPAAPSSGQTSPSGGAAPQRSAQTRRTKPRRGPGNAD
jgi:hypothetical protein